MNTTSIIILDGIELDSNHIHAFTSTDAFNQYILDNAEKIAQQIPVEVSDIYDAFHNDSLTQYGVYVYEIPLHS